MIQATQCTVSWYVVDDTKIAHVNQDVVNHVVKQSRRVLERWKSPEVLSTQLRTAILARLSEHYPAREKLMGLGWTQVHTHQYQEFLHQGQLRVENCPTIWWCWQIFIPSHYRVPNHAYQHSDPLVRPHNQLGEEVQFRPSEEQENKEIYWLAVQKP